MTKNTNIWLNGIMGVVVGDALGCPVQCRQSIVTEKIERQRNAVAMRNGTTATEA